MRAGGAVAEMVREESIGKVALQRAVENRARCAWTLPAAAAP